MFRACAAEPFAGRQIDGQLADFRLARQSATWRPRASFGGVRSVDKGRSGSSRVFVLSIERTRGATPRLTALRARRMSLSHRNHTSMARMGESSLSTVLRAITARDRARPARRDPRLPRPRGRDRTRLRGQCVCPLRPIRSIRARAPGSTCARRPAQVQASTPAARGVERRAAIKAVHPDEDRPGFGCAPAAKHRALSFHTASPQISGDPEVGAQAHQSVLLFSIRSDRSTASPPPLWGRTKEGGRAVLRDKRAATHSIISQVRETPHPGPPPQEGAGAQTPTILTKCNML